VNWLMTRMGAPAPAADTFMTPFSSARMRSRQILSAMVRASAVVSSVPTPSSTHNPRPWMAPTTLSSTRTDARDTR
jgi:hypothetical protein